ncbi:hypothetical protein [Nocardioides plantarum]|uniref:Uncharacterized protein n=1 Tax=Nocardioides plantarum TaxID=29299 RepID=A0ABV5K417_9ACTN|nr:hypothetical protein [Nocardioides plantarum]
MTTPGPPPPAPLEVFEEALGKPTSHPAVAAVMKALGGVYEVGDYLSRTRHDYDPDIARSVRWEFTRVPAANYYPTHLRVLDGVVVSMSLHGGLVAGSHPKAVTLVLPVEEELVWLGHEVTDGSWPPRVVRRGQQHLLDLTVPQGHWDARYRFPLTPTQVEALRASRETWQWLWDALIRICQSRRFLDDPATLPGDAQRTIDRFCGEA